MCDSKAMTHVKLPGFGDQAHRLIADFKPTWEIRFINRVGHDLADALKGM